MKKVQLIFDSVKGPIFPSDSATGEPETGIAVIDNDDVLPNINLECSLTIMVYNTLKDHGVDQESLNKYKKDILELIRLIKERLNKINDGSYEVDDLVTAMFF